MSTSAVAVLAAIDSAVEDWECAADAASWHADGGPDELAAPILNPMGMFDFSPSMEAVAVFGQAMRDLGRSFAAAFAEVAKPVNALAAMLAHDQDVRQRPRWHRRRCRVCNPAGFCDPLPYGREYHRRQKARRRRNRR